MERYINADKLKDEYYELYHHGTTAVKRVLPVFVDLLDNVPTADVAEVKHGYWKWERKIEAQAQNRLYCSVCDNECLSKNNYYVKSNFCPHCGVKMDGGK